MKTLETFGGAGGRHHLREFLDVNQSIAVGVDTLHHFPARIQVTLLSHPPQHLQQFLRADFPIAVQVEHRKCILDVSFVDSPSHVVYGDELLEVYVAVAV